MLDPDVVERIRTIFLHESQHVTIADAARMLGWSDAEMAAAIRDGNIETTKTCSGRAFSIREVAEKAMELWALADIEAALGREASLILPPALRTRRLALRLPAYQISVLQVLAADASESVDSMLTRMFEELADLNNARYASLIPGFYEALVWPRKPVDWQHDRFAS